MKRIRIAVGVAAGSSILAVVTAALAHAGNSL